MTTTGVPATQVDVARVDVAGVTSETLELLYRRASVRAFTDEPVPAGMLDDLLTAALRAPTSFNLQAYALVVVTDPGQRQRLAGLVGQAHVARAPVVVVVCADLDRLYQLGHHHGEPVGPEHADLAVTATIDASLAGMCLSLGAESLGLGTVMLGAVRNRPDDVARLLALPPAVTALFGVCLGWPAHAPGGRPRLRTDLLVHAGRYDIAVARRALTADAGTLWHVDGPVSAGEVSDWRTQIVRGLRRARARLLPARPSTPHPPE